jgi:hypothetical protein
MHTIQRDVQSDHSERPKLHTRIHALSEIFLIRE